jgi:xylan 1,4-beta-xylosidase
MMGAVRWILILSIVFPACLFSQDKPGYTNPIVRGINPDPSICRVGNDYYLVTGSNMYPGIPVYHSRDLVNWKLIGYCLTKASHFFLDKNNNAPVMYAPTLRYNKGIFYMITTDVAGGGNFFVTATDPAGPWSDPVQIDRDVFDPSLFFDDNGKVYYTRRGDFKDKNIVQAEIDIKTGKLLTPLKAISKGLVSTDTEAPHLFKRGSWYYLTMGEGGSRALHMQTIARSRNPWGPFEKNPANPVISQHNAWWYHIRALGHADFIDAPDGSSWAVCLGTRHSSYDAFSAIGRETFLLPVVWKNGWPVVNPMHQYHLFINIPGLPTQTFEDEKVNDEFDQQTLSLTWNKLAYPLQQWMSLSEKPGHLLLHGTPSPLAFSTQVAFVGLRQKEMSGECSTAMEFTPEANNEEAGITVFQTQNYHYDLFVSLRNEKRVAVLRKSVGDLSEETNITPVQEGKIQMKVVMDPDNYYFQVYQNNEWVTLGKGMTNLITTEVARVWTGVYIGMYSTGNGNACKKPADFDWFKADFAAIKFNDF